MRDPDVTKAPLCFPFTNRRKLSSDVDEVVDLHQIEAFCLKSRHRTLHRLDSCLLTTGPNFRGEKHLVVKRKLGGQAANHFLCPAVHWRGIDDAAAKFDKKRQHLAELALVLRVKIDIEHVPSAQPNHR